MLRLKTAIARVITTPVVGQVLRRLYRGVLPAMGIKMDVRSPLVTDTTVASLFFGLYESGERRAVTRHAKRGIPVVELGASLGYLTAHIAKTCRPPRHVAVEANPHLSPLFQRNIQLNGLTNITMVDGAISYAGAELVSLDVRDQNTGSRVAANEPETERACLVPTVALRRLMEEHHISEHILVSDIEGAEVSMFWHERHLLRDNCRQIIAELHPAYLHGALVSVDDVIALLTGEMGFRMTQRSGNVVVCDNPG